MLLDMNTLGIEWTLAFLAIMALLFVAIVASRAGGRARGGLAWDQFKRSPDRDGWNERPEGPTPPLDVGSTKQGPTGMHTEQELREILEAVAGGTMESPAGGHRAVHEVVAQLPGDAQRYLAELFIDSLLQSGSTVNDWIESVSGTVGSSNLALCPYPARFLGP